MTGLTLVRVHEPDAVLAIVEQAWQIVADSAVPEGLQVAAFEKACDLLAARIPIMPQTAPLDLAPFRNGR